MISLLLKLAVNIIIGVIAILSLLSYFNFTANFPDIYIYGAMIAWVFFGTLLSRIHFRDSSLIGAWLNPLSLITAPIGLSILLIATLASINNVNQSTALHLAWLIAPSILLSWLIYSAHMQITKRKLPFILAILTIANIQLFVLYSGFAHLYLDGRSPLIMYQPKSTHHYLLTAFTMLSSWGLAHLYVQQLRRFEFYQLKEHLLNSMNKVDFETKKIIAVHEAGHCLCYSFFKTPPQIINIYLYEKALEKVEGAMGLVEATVPKLNTKDFDEWHLLTLLAGQRAELMLYKKTSQGASDDVAKWKSNAHDFLTKYDKSYFNQPENEDQMMVNAEKEKDLFNKHIKILDAFFLKNKSLLKELAAKAYRFNPLEAHHIHPYLLKTKPTKDFPHEEKKGLFR